MAVANPYVYKTWDEWKKEMEENRRRKCRQRVHRCTKEKVNHEEGDAEDSEEGTDSDEFEVREEEGEEENEAGGESEEEEEMEEEQEEEGKKVKLEAKVNEKGGKRGKVKEAQDIEEEEGEDENEEEENSDVEEEMDLTEAEENEEIETEEENEEGETEEENEEGETEEENEEGETEEEIENEENEETDENEEHEEMDEEEDTEMREGGVVEEEDDGRDEQPEQARTGHYDLRAQFRENVNGRTEEVPIRQNQESTVQEDGTMKDEDNSSDSDEANDEGPDWMGEESHNSGERQEGEDESEKLTSEQETVVDFWTTHDEEFQHKLEELQEEDEDYSEDEEGSEEEDEDCNDEDVVKIYCKDDYPLDIFQTLTTFRDSSLLTDLNVSTEDGTSFNVHSLVLASVSSLIRERMRKRNLEEKNVDVDDTSAGINTWSVSLGPKVDHVGLEAVVEFAYCGLISRLNKDTVERIKAAAEILGAPRVLDLCTEEESTKTGEQSKEEQISPAEQMLISLESIKRLWIDRVACDVILQAIGESLHAHRVILAASSDYFRGMFTLGMKESHQPWVTLPFLLASELEVLISCSYSGALPLSWSCVFEITNTALQIQYQTVLSLCLNFLQHEINPHSCLDVVSFAEAYKMAQLQEVADDFVLRQFQKVARTSKFKDLPAKQLLKYLNSRSLCVPSELVVFNAVVAWIKAKPRLRLRLAKELMKTIHFPLMTFKEFKEVRSLAMWSDHTLAKLYEAIFADFCSNKTARQSECRIYLPKESLVLIGGDQISEDLCNRCISRELWFGNSLRNHTGIKKAMEWRSLGDMPEQARFSHEVAVIEGQLYVFGGKMYYGIHDALNSVYRYDPCKNSWESLAEMQERRSSFSVVVLDGKIYAIGGHCDREHSDSVERYCPASNSWSFTQPLDLPLSGHVAEVLQGQIFISGGLNNDYTCLASMIRYDPESGSTYLENMTKPRASHCMEILGDCLYVAGGFTTGVDINIVDQLDCEVYNPAADSWTAFVSLPVPHVGAGSAVLEGKFYVLGGYSQEDYTDTKTVHRYDPTTQRWENMGKMPGPNNDIRAAVLCLPTHLRS